LLERAGRRTITRHERRVSLDLGDASALVDHGERPQAEPRSCRALVLLLTIAGAILVTLGGSVSGFDKATGKVLGLARAIALALAPVISRRSAAQPSVRSWVRARSVSERLKTELYFYLTRTGRYADRAVADRQLVQRRDSLLADVDDLGPRSERVTPVVKEPPPITDVAS
jgi:hypothetical protein